MQRFVEGLLTLQSIIVVVSIGIIIYFIIKRIKEREDETFEKRDN